MPVNEGKPYQPSNGSEGCWFTGKFCEQCIHEKYSHTMNDNDKSCDILPRTMCFSINDPEYPKEWIYDAENKPTCTAWVKWDWDQDDDGNWNDPVEPEPGDPNQLMLFTEWDEIEYFEPKVEPLKELR